MSQSNSMPLSYVVCTAEEGQCPLREHCLRSKVYSEDTENLKREPIVRVVNFKNPDTHSLTEQCTLYRSDQTLRFAKGMTHLFDFVPKVKYSAVQQAVQSCFSSNRTYFYCKKGERLISPKEQESIAKVFQRFSIDTLPQYDNYEECYDWS